MSDRSYIYATADRFATKNECSQILRNLDIRLVSMEYACWETGGTQIVYPLSLFTDFCNDPFEGCLTQQWRISKKTSQEELRNLSNKILRPSLLSTLRISPVGVTKSFKSTAGKRSVCATTAGMLIHVINDTTNLIIPFSKKEQLHLHAMYYQVQGTFCSSSRVIVIKFSRSQDSPR